MNFAHFCEFWCFSLGKQARFTLNFCSGMPLRKVHELTFFWFGLPGPLLKTGCRGKCRKSASGSAPVLVSTEARIPKHFFGTFLGTLFGLALSKALFSALFLVGASALLRMVGRLVPKGPFRTKNTTAIEKIVDYYAVVFLLRPPNLLRCGPFFERKHVCNSQENGVRTRCAAIANHPGCTKNTTRSKFTIFRTAGSFG